MHRRNYAIENQRNRPDRSYQETKLGGDGCVFDQMRDDVLVVGDVLVVVAVGIVVVVAAVSALVVAVVTCVAVVVDVVADVVVVGKTEKGTLDMVSVVSVVVDAGKLVDVDVAVIAVVVVSVVAIVVAVVSVAVGGVPSFDSSRVSEKKKQKQQ